MKKANVTISCPAHPALAEMMTALEEDINYRVVGTRVRETDGISGVTNPGVKLGYQAAVRARRNAFGAVAYHWARSAMLLRSNPKGNLVHCCSHLAYGSFPWVGDYENVNVLAFYSPGLVHSKFFVAHLRRMFGDSSCRAIRVWSATAALSFRALFDDHDIRAKVRVIHPSIEFPAEARERRRKAAAPRILFVAKVFWIKGGALFLEAIRKLRRQCEFHVDFICELPPECDHYRGELEGVVSFHEPNFSRSELFARFYSNADIFVMLGMSDSYGVALLEASAFALPIVAMQLHSGLSDLLSLTGNAIRIAPAYQIFDTEGLHALEPVELVRQIRQNAQREVIDRIAAALEALISDPDKRESMGQKGRAAVLEGPFSTAKMREAMLGFYKEVMD